MSLVNIVASYFVTLKDILNETDVQLYTGPMTYYTKIFMSLKGR